MLQGLVSIFRQVIVGAIVTLGSGAAVVIGAAAYRYLSRSVRKIAAKIAPKQPEVIEVRTVRIVVLVLVGGDPPGCELPPGTDN